MIHHLILPTERTSSTQLDSSETENKTETGVCVLFQHGSVRSVKKNQMISPNTHTHKKPCIWRKRHKKQNPHAVVALESSREALAAQLKKGDELATCWQQSAHTPTCQSTKHRHTLTKPSF